MRPDLSQRDRPIWWILRCETTLANDRFRYTTLLQWVILTQPHPLIIFYPTPDRKHTTSSNANNGGDGCDHCFLAVHCTVLSVDNPGYQSKNQLKRIRATATTVARIRFS